MTFFPVIVIYNIDIDRSKTCFNIRKIRNHDLKVIIVDNSTVKNRNEEKSKKYGWKYISMNGNAGLSRAYNKALDFLKNEEGVVIWFDDDSEVTQKYFDVLEKNVHDNHDVDIFVPVIRGQDGKFWSPNSARLLKNKQLKNENDVIRNSRFNAINSCMAVRLSLYNTYRYNEKLFLDQVDHNFCEDQRNAERKFMKMNVVIQHSFSTKETQKTMAELKARYSIMIPDFVVYSQKTRIRRALCSIKVIGWGIREGIRNRQPLFIFWCIRELNNSLKQKSTTEYYS